MRRQPQHRLHRCVYAYRKLARILPAILLLLFWVCAGMLVMTLTQTQAQGLTAANVGDSQDVIAQAVHAASMVVENAILHDPTRPPADVAPAADGDSIAPVAAGGAALTTILFSPNRKLAIINGQVVRVGEHIGGIEVLSITANAVHVRDSNQQGKEYTLMLYNQPVKVKTRVKTVQPADQHNAIRQGSGLSK